MINNLERVFIHLRHECNSFACYLLKNCSRHFANGNQPKPMTCQALWWSGEKEPGNNLGGF